MYQDASSDRNSRSARVAQENTPKTVKDLLGGADRVAPAKDPGTNKKGQQILPKN